MNGPPFSLPSPCKGEGISLPNFSKCRGFESDPPYLLRPGLPKPTNLRVLEPFPEKSPSNLIYFGGFFFCEPRCRRYAITTLILKPYSVEPIMYKHMPLSIRFSESQKMGRFGIKRGKTSLLTKTRIPTICICRAMIRAKAAVAPGTGESQIINIFLGLKRQF